MTKQTTALPIAIIELSGKQYLVKTGTKIEAEKLDLKDGESLKLDSVLLTSNGESTSIGTPYIEGASVELKLDKQIKGEKVEIRKFKAKSRYRRTTGHRQIKSFLTVTDINLK